MNTHIGFETMHISKSTFPFEIRELHMTKQLKISNSSYIDTKHISAALQTYALYSSSGADVHLHDFCQLTMLKKGKMLYCYNDNQYELNEGDAIIINAYIPHTWFALQESVISSAGFYHFKFSTDSYATELNQHFRLLYSSQYPIIPIKSEKMGNSISKLFDNLTREYTTKSLGYNSVINNLLVNFSTLLIRHFIPYKEFSSLNDKSLLLTLNYIDEHLSEELNLSTIANIANMNANYFSSYFKKNMGIGLTFYINRQRLSRAVVLIKTTNKPITDIAFECGFSSISTFYDHFTSTYSMSPLKFRKYYGISS